MSGMQAHLFSSTYITTISFIFRICNLQKQQIEIMQIYQQGKVIYTSAYIGVVDDFRLLVWQRFF